MKETEVKILNIDRAEIEEKLSNLGAEKVFDGEIEALFFDFSDGSIAKSNSVLRLRKEGVKVLLTFKKVVESQRAKIAEEHSVEVSGFEEAKKILEFLCLSVTESMRKHRVSFQVDDALFDIDKYEGKYDFIPTFLEIEATNVDLVYKYAERLGFKAKDCLPWSVKELVDYYSSQKQAEPQRK